jgi:asparagine synthase (glutamine-hydrolysing)
MEALRPDMCGIAGIWSAPGAEPPRRDEIERMVGALHHRGPDGRGALVDGPIGLGHARLSIIDLDGGAQPMGNEDGSIQVVFNGEIFNYLELREILVAQGHRFRTASDTEVLVHLYEEHGDDFVCHLNGQFAIALWDGVRRRLVLARDRVGIRPLFHTRVGGRLVFASEVKALFAQPQVPRRLDPGGLASLFGYWSVLPPGSVFEGIESLPPGHLLTVDAHGSRRRRYWDWPFAETQVPAWSDERWADELEALLVDAVRLQLRADVPVGAYLSGGLDSSIITTIVRRRSRTPLRSFSLTFEDAEFDESAHQRALVERLGTQHSSIEAGKAAIAAAFPRMVWHAESPVVRTAPAPMMLLADSVRAAGYKVVLTGEGADEAFGGYDIFKEAAIRRFVARAPGSTWRAALLGRLYPYLAHSPAAGRAMTQGFFGSGLDQRQTPGFAHMLRVATTGRVISFFGDEWRHRLQAFDAPAALQAQLPDGFMRWPALARDQYIEANTLMSGYLLSSQGDRMAMAASVEARYPFLDHRVLEFSCRMPARLKLCGLHEKVLLRRAFAADLPPSIGQRTKQPYRAPDSACFFEDGARGRRLRDETAELLEARSLADAGLFDPAAVARLVEKCRSGRAIGFGDNMAFVGVLSTMWLHRQFIRGTAPG